MAPSFRLTGPLECPGSGFAVERASLCLESIRPPKIALTTSDDRSERQPCRVLPACCLFQCFQGLFGVSKARGANLEGCEAEKGVSAGRSEEHTSELQSPCNLVC